MTTQNPSAQPDTLVLPLRSDPPWLLGGLAAVTAVSLAGFVFMFTRTRLSPALGLLPGLTAAVFLGSALAAWGRRQGASLFLDVSPTGVDVRDPARRQEVLDLGAAWSAVLLVNKAKPGRRMLVVGQRGDATVVLESADRGALPDHLATAWAGRTLAMDLDALPLSPSSAGVVALAAGATLDPLLAKLGGALHPDAPWLLQASQAGGILVRPGEVRVGRKAVALGAGRKAVTRAVEVNGMTLAALELAESHEGVPASDDDTILLACEDAPVAPRTATTDRTPDAYVPLVVYELVRAVAAG